MAIRSTSCGSARSGSCTAARVLWTSATSCTSQGRGRSLAESSVRDRELNGLSVRHIVCRSASDGEEGAKSRCVTVERVVLARLEDGRSRIADVKDEMPDFETDSSRSCYRKTATRGFRQHSTLKTCVSRAEKHTVSTQIKQELVALIAALELEEHAVSARRRKLHDRIAIFPSEAHQQAERELSAHRRGLHRRIDEARAELARAEVAERDVSTG